MQPCLIIHDPCGYPASVTNHVCAVLLILNMPKCLDTTYVDVSEKHRKQPLKNLRPAKNTHFATFFGGDRQKYILSLVQFFTMWWSNRYFRTCCFLDLLLRNLGEKQQRMQTLQLSLSKSDFPWECSKCSRCIYLFDEDS